MQDVELRSLERQWEEGDRSPELTVSLLQARARTGLLGPRRLAMAAAMGFEPALALGVEPDARLLELAEHYSTPVFQLVPGFRAGPRLLSDEEEAELALLLFQRALPALRSMVSREQRACLEQVLEAGRLLVAGKLAKTELEARLRAVDAAFGQTFDSVSVPARAKNFSKDLLRAAPSRLVEHTLRVANYQDRLVGAAGGAEEREAEELRLLVARFVCGLVRAPAWTGALPPRRERPWAAAQRRWEETGQGGRELLDQRLRHGAVLGPTDLLVLAGRLGDADAAQEVAERSLGRRGEERDLSEVEWELTFQHADPSLPPPAGLCVEPSRLYLLREDPTLRQALGVWTADLVIRVLSVLPGEVQPALDLARAIRGRLLGGERNLEELLGLFDRACTSGASLTGKLGELADLALSLARTPAAWERARSGIRYTVEQLAKATMGDEPRREPIMTEGAGGTFVMHGYQPSEEWTKWKAGVRAGLEAEWRRQFEGLGELLRIERSQPSSIRVRPREPRLVAREREGSQEHVLGECRSLGSVEILAKAIPELVLLAGEWILRGGPGVEVRGQPQGAEFYVLGHGDEFEAGGRRWVVTYEDESLQRFVEERRAAGPQPDSGG